ncbi:probable serine/threonine-protein kinase DDB_G0278509 isoform X5 [Hydra vulgaris]|uniref:Probable serine/threonine-protein kinase DDB_G0278509 isoform X5 n=1 Tax=Hydra vulgaris TaxID=6087 RepID=A0ABM4B7F4_HYDVU
MNPFCIGSNSQVVNIYTYKYFPVRKTKLTQNGGGAWCVDFVNKRNNLMKLLNKCLIIEDNIGLPLSYEYLIKSFHLKDPSDACVLNISGRSLNSPVNTDFSLFKNVCEVDASDNNLTLDAFCSFPKIEKLFLQANNMKFIDLSNDSFPYLQSLDLSYNFLCNKAIINLGKLKCLKDLLLCGCSLKKLPQMFDVGAKDHRLTVLKLGNNKICSVPDLSYQHNIHSNKNLSFQCLSSLDLSNNQIFYESSLLPATYWPNLTILMLWGNPIIDTQRADASILDENFQKLFDIKVIRQKPSHHFLRNFNLSAKKILNIGKIINKPIPSIKYNNLQLLESNTSNFKNKLINENQKKMNSFNEEAVPSFNNSLEELNGYSITKPKNVFLTQLNEESEFSMPNHYPIEDDDFEETELSIKRLPMGASIKRLKAILDKQKFLSFSKNKKKSTTDKQMMVNEALEDMRVQKTYVKENLATLLEQRNNSSKFHYREVKELAKSMQRKYDEVRKELMKPILLSYENEV